MSKLRYKDNSASIKLRSGGGAGDGAKVYQAPLKVQERTPVPSSRKFTPTLVKNDKLQLQLKKTIIEMESQEKSASSNTSLIRLKKSKSVAEITPTKSKPKKPRCDDDEALSTLHATPRPMIAVAATGDPSSRRQQETKAAKLIYHHLVLFAWRRNRARLTTLSESLRRHQDQIAQLELQVDVLKKLGKSECEKRNEAINNSTRVSKRFEEIEAEKQSLIQDKIDLENELNRCRENQRITLIDFENMKNDANSRRLQVEVLDTEIKKQKLEMDDMIAERNRLYAKLNVQNSTFHLQINAINELEDKLKLTQLTLSDVQNTKEIQQKKYYELLNKQQMEIAKRTCLEDELKGLYAAKKDMEDEIETFRIKMDDLNSKLTALISENELLSTQLQALRDEQKNWWLMTTNFIQITWCVLHHGAKLMLPML